MRKPIVAIVGRPNVGKSTLINRIVGSRRAIVDDLPGVTRDRAYYDAEWLNRHFTLADTGGLSVDEEGLFADKVNEQVLVAIEEADVLIFVVDGTTGITAWDEAIAKRLRMLSKPVFLAVNKIDSREQMGYTGEFYGLSLGDPHPISAMHGTVGVGDLLDLVIKTFDTMNPDEITTEAEESAELKLAFVGRPNVGKSSLVNSLLGEDRTIVSDVAGTTRDAIDTDFVWQDRKFTLVDTAGIRKKSKVSYGIEMFSVDRAIRALRRADVTVLVLDAIEGVTDQDKRIIETSNQAGRGMLIVVNKWDLIENKTPKSTKEYEQKLFADIPHARFTPVLFTSAKTGQRLDKILDWAVKIYANNHRRIQTSVVNQLISEAFSLSAPPPSKNKRLKIYYATQVDVAPPTFLLFVNSDKLLNESYRRYLEHHLRKNIEFSGTPIRLICRNKQEKGD